MHAPRCGLLLLLLLSIALVPVRPGADAHVLEIRRIVRPELVVPSVVDAVSSALAQPSDCVPGGGIVLSVTNKHHARLRPLQFALIRHRACFMRRVVSVCFNNMTDTYGTCVRSTFVVPPSDYRRSNYANLIWAKWRIIGDALRVARIALWLDADVVILRNPWAVLHLLRPGNDAAPQYDIRYQSEPPPTADQASTCAAPLPVCADCAGINGGQLLVRNAQVANRIYQHRPQNLSNTDRLDQDWADAIIHNSSRFSHLLRNSSQPTFSSCVLPDSFAAQCWAHPSFMRSEAGRRRGGRHALFGAACSRATHHFNCVTSRREKGSLMKSLIEAWASRCGNSSADDG